MGNVRQGQLQQYIISSDLPDKTLQCGPCRLHKVSKIVTSTVKRSKEWICGNGCGQKYKSTNLSTNYWKVLFFFWLCIISQSSIPVAQSVKDSDKHSKMKQRVNPWQRLHMDRNTNLPTFQQIIGKSLFFFWQCIWMFNSCCTKCQR